MVRRANAEDAAVIAGLLSELGYPTSSHDARVRLAALGPDDLVLVADEDAGMIALHRIPLLAEGGALLRITALIVRDGKRGRGVARALLHACEQAAREWGCGLIEVSSGRRPERDAAHRFYRSAGFVETSSRSVRYWKAPRTGY